MSTVKKYSRASLQKLVKDPDHLMTQADIDHLDSLGLVSATSRKFTSRVMYDTNNQACTLKTPAFTVKGSKKTSPKDRWSQEMHDYVERTQRDWLESSSTHEVVVKYS